jgi:hypothetical protein
MIPSEEAHDLPQSFGVPLVHIEKDYVMSWLLWGITQDFNSHWQETIVCPTNAIIVAANAITLFQQFINALFQPDLLLEVQNLRMPCVWYPYRVPSTIRETIIAAGRARQLIRLRYHGYERNVEPYSFLYKIRKKDGCGVEYFYGYDRTRGKTIKSFFYTRFQA